MVGGTAQVFCSGTTSDRGGAACSLAKLNAKRRKKQRLIEHGCDVDQRLDFGFRTVTARHPSRAEKAVLEKALDKFLARYQKDPEAAKKLISVGESPAPKQEKPEELAAYTMVASLLLNLDETLNKN